MPPLPHLPTAVLPARVRRTRLPRALACALGYPLMVLGALLVLTPLPGSAVFAAGLGILAEHARFAREALVNGRRRLRLARRRLVLAIGRP
jgi:hypothetical protein